MRLRLCACPIREMALMFKRMFNVKEKGVGRDGNYPTRVREMVCPLYARNDHIQKVSVQNLFGFYPIKSKQVTLLKERQFV